MKTESKHGKKACCIPVCKGPRANDGSCGPTHGCVRANCDHRRPRPFASGYHVCPGFLIHCLLQEFFFYRLPTSKTPLLERSVTKYKRTSIRINYTTDHAHTMHCAPAYLKGPSSIYKRPRFSWAPDNLCLLPPKL